MANSNKCKCKECKRTISITDQFCPYCSSPNPYAEESSGLPKKVKAVQKAPIEDEDLEEFIRQEANESTDYLEEDIDDNIEDFEENEFEDDDMCADSDESYKDPFEIDSLSEEEQQVDEYDSYEENYGGSNHKVTEKVNKSGPSKGSSNNSFNQNSRDGRSPINWTDEEKTESVEYSDIYDENGVYNPNYDGFYNDTLPKIQNEIDSLVAGREKTILKIVFGFVAIFGIIVYLILTI